RGVDVVIDRDRWMAELRFRRMDDIAPEQEAFSLAFDHVAAHAGRVTVFGDAAYAGEQAGRTVERLELAATVQWVHGLVRLLERRSTFRCRFGVRTTIEPTFRLPLVDIDHGLGKGTLATDAERTGMVGMDMGEKAGVDVRRLVPGRVHVGDQAARCLTDQFSG